MMQSNHIYEPIYTQRIMCSWISMTVCITCQHTRLMWRGEGLNLTVPALVFSLSSAHFPHRPNSEEIQTKWAERQTEEKGKKERLKSLPPTALRSSSRIKPFIKLSLGEDWRNDVEVFSVCPPLCALAKRSNLFSAMSDSKPSVKVENCEKGKSDLYNTTCLLSFPKP